MASDSNEESFAKVINLAEMRAKLRPAPPPEPLISSLTRALANIDAAFASNGTPTDG